ncbi:MAG: penicillin-binding transpeptidase domain-containing protein [Eubacteriales bacterium]
MERLKADEVRKFIADNSIKGVYLAQETKRYYKYGNLASNVIGFSGSDGTGLFGIEYQYNKYLTGTPGRIITAKNGIGQALPFDYESYIDAKDGQGVVLTIDWSIQNFLEKSLESALAESKAANRVAGIVMDVNTGAILAMSVKPDFNLNDPYTLDAQSLELLGSLGLSGEDFDNKKAELQYKLWNNKTISEPYEPGSTFKVITSVMGFDTKKVTASDMFHCPGYYVVSGVRISCHLTRGHGSITFAQGVQLSCNPTFMQLAERIGGTTFLKFYKGFGYEEKTGVDLPGEAMSLFHPDNAFNTVELATYSFGQTFKVTMLQHITAISAVANGGKLMTPYLVKSIVDSEGNVVKSFEPTVRRTVVSEEACKQITAILEEGVVSGGSARNAYVKGYRVAAKTGTSEKRDGDADARIGSTVAFAPADDPQVAVLIIVDEPTVGSVYGGTIAAPFVSKVLADTLPYLGVEPVYTEDELKSLETVVLDYTNYDLNKAKADITKLGLQYDIQGSGTVVTDQIPSVGSKLPKGGKVILYTNGSVPEKTVSVPDVLSRSTAQVLLRLQEAGLNLSIGGAENSEGTSAIAISQVPAAGEMVEPGTIITVEFRHYEGMD